MPFEAPRLNVLGCTHHPVSNSKINDQDSIYTNMLLCSEANFVHLVVSVQPKLLFMVVSLQCLLDL